MFTVRILVSYLAIMIFNPEQVLTQDSESVLEECLDSNIKTILLHRSGLDLTWPVIYFKSDDKLRLRFDYVGESKEDFYYSVVACTYDWKLNENPDHFYLDGFNSNLVENKYTSFNTWKYYEHFMTKVPSEELKFLTSGNYIINVYKGPSTEEVVFTRKFCLTESKVNIKAIVKKPDPQNQEIQIEIDIEKLELTNPLAEIKVVVIKNNDWNNQLNLAFKPVLRENKLHIDLPYQLITGGGNEFRYVDIKSIKYISDQLDSIKYISPETHFYLKPDKLNQYEPYFSSTDLNGRFYIDMEDSYDRHIESDYVNAHFVLESAQAFRSDVYIYGALTNWETNESNCMNYNPEKGIYEKTLFLKQGYYNYAYAIKDFSTQKTSFDYTEGNHSEAENEYAIFVYLRETMSDFDRLVGFQILNSTGEEKEIQFTP